jgi:hypothetical protein
MGNPMLLTCFPGGLRDAFDHPHDGIVAKNPVFEDPPMNRYVGVSLQSRQTGVFAISFLRINTFTNVAHTFVAKLFNQKINIH